jgi:hypothetical protein
MSARPGATGLVLTTFDFIYQKDVGEIKGRMNGLGQGMRISDLLSEELWF